MAGHVISTTKGSAGDSLIHMSQLHHCHGQYFSRNKVGCQVILILFKIQENILLGLKCGCLTLEIPCCFV